VHTYAIGDVHGCARTLQRLIDSLPLDREVDRLWLVGDLVSHGADSVGALRAVRALQNELGQRLVAVLGNHDLRLLTAHAGHPVPSKVELLLDEVLAASDGARLLAWLVQRPLLHCDGDTVMVHAGLHPRWTVGEARRRAKEVESILASPRRDIFLSFLYGKARDAADPPQDLERALESTRVLTTIRTLEDSGKLCDHTGPPENAPAHCRPWFAVDDRAHDDATIVFGHWAACGLRLGRNWLALDSGCAWGGPLSAVRIEDRRVFQAARID
jgi:bis(5'-nucleosyl)-tetraphosphatase (symmetrical)